MFGHVGLERGGGEASGLWEMGQSVFNIGPEELHTKILSMYIITVDILLICRLKIKHMRELCHLCLFRPISMVANC
jgi:hypothetical protein